MLNDSKDKNLLISFEQNITVEEEGYTRIKTIYDENTTKRDQSFFEYIDKEIRDNASHFRTHILFIAFNYLLEDPEVELTLKTPTTTENLALNEKINQAISYLSNDKQARIQKI